MPDAQGFPTAATASHVLKGRDLFKFFDRLHDVWNWLDLFSIAVDGELDELQLVRRARHKLFRANIAWLDEVISEYTHFKKVQVELLCFTPAPERDLKVIHLDLEQAHGLLREIPEHSRAQPAHAMTSEVERMLHVLDAYRAEHNYCIESLGDNVLEVINSLVSRRSMERY